MSNQNQADVVLSINRSELAALSAIFTFDDDPSADDDSAGTTWKADLSDRALNGIEDEDADVTDAEDIVDQLAAKISYLSALANH